MSRAITRALIAFLFIVSVAASALSANLALRTLPAAQATDPAVAAVFERFVQARVEAQAAGSLFEDVERLATGNALETVRREAAASPDPVVGLAYVEGRFALLMRAGSSALAEGIYTVRARGVDTRVGEHAMLELVDGRWLVSAVWRLALDPGTPLVEEPSPSPSVEPSASADANATPPPTAAACPAELLDRAAATLFERASDHGRIEAQDWPDGGSFKLAWNGDALAATLANGDEVVVAGERAWSRTAGNAWRDSAPDLVALPSFTLELRAGGEWIATEDRCQYSFSDDAGGFSLSAEWEMPSGRLLGLGASAADAWLLAEFVDPPTIQPPTE
jgi:hypothetical protein